MAPRSGCRGYKEQEVTLLSSLRPPELAPPALRRVLSSLGKCKVPSSPRQRRDPDTRKPENQRLSHDALVTEPDLTDLDLFWS